SPLSAPSFYAPSLLAALPIYSPWGYEMRVAGLNPSALRYAGASPIWSVNLTFILAGLAAGIAGATQIIGRPPTYALYGDLSNLGDRKSTRLNSSHVKISYAVF